MLKAFQFVLWALSHNDNHFFEVEFRQRRYPLCTRCTGMLLGAFTTLPLVLLAGLYRAPGEVVAGVAVAHFLPDFVYWALTRIRKVPDLLLVRGVNGFILGAGIALYGQADLAWGRKLAIPALLFLIVLIGNPLIGKLRPPQPR